MISALELAEPQDVLFRVQRGLAGYVSYLAACEMNPSFSEYVLYEPILRILTARGYTVKCEVECPEIEQPKKGDRKRLDFVANGHGVQFALEVKWAKSRKPDVSNDRAKLNAFKNAGRLASDRAFWCVFGRRSHIEPLETPTSFTEPLPIVVAGFRKTRFGCRIFEMT
jgi:hypothetical protein